MTRKFTRKKGKIKLRKSKRIYGGNNFYLSYIKFRTELKFDKYNSPGTEPGGKKIENKGPFEYIIGMAHHIIVNNRTLNGKDIDHDTTCVIKVRKDNLTRLNTNFVNLDKLYIKYPDMISYQKCLFRCIQFMVIEMKKMRDKCFGGPKKQFGFDSTKDYPIFGSFLVKTIESIDTFLKANPIDTSSEYDPTKAYEAWAETPEDNLKDYMEKTTLDDFTKLFGL